MDTVRGEKKGDDSAHCSCSGSFYYNMHAKYPTCWFCRSLIFSDEFVGKCLEKFVE